MYKYIIYIYMYIFSFLKPYEILLSFALPLTRGSPVGRLPFHVFGTQACRRSAARRAKRSRSLRWLR